MVAQKMRKPQQDLARTIEKAVKVDQEELSEIRQEVSWSYGEDQLGDKNDHKEMEEDEKGLIMDVEHKAIRNTGPENMANHERRLNLPAED